MRWYVKSLIFKALSLVPGGIQLYNYSQHQISRSTAPTPARILQKLRIGLDYWYWLEQHGRTKAVHGAAVVDLGAGWHPTIPLLFHQLGARRQVLLDVSPLMTDELVASTLDLFHSAWPLESKKISNLPPPPEAPAPARSRSQIFEARGIEYLAPYQGRFAEASRFDSAFSTQVLQHIPEEMMTAVFKEVFTWLKPGGLFLATTHLTFQFGSPDTNPHQYQHLAISPTDWRRWFSSRIMYFNRFKGPDYRRALEAAGFRIVALQNTPPSAVDQTYFAATKVHPCFAHLAPEDLAARHLFFVAEKPQPESVEC